MVSTIVKGIKRAMAEYSREKIPAAEYVRMSTEHQQYSTFVNPSIRF